MKGRWLLVALVLAGAGCGRKPETAKVVPDDGKRPLVLATTAWNPPYSYRDETTGEIVGQDIDVARAAAVKLGRALEVRPMPFETMLAQVKGGTIDFAAASITVTPGRRKDVDFSHAYATDGSAFLYRAGEEAPTMVRVERMKLGTINGTVSDLYLCYHDLDPVRFDIYDEAVAALQAKRIDTLFYDAAPLRATAAKSGGLLKTTELETRERYAVAVRKDMPELLRAVNAVLEEKGLAE